RREHVAQAVGGQERGHAAKPVAGGALAVAGVLALGRIELIGHGDGALDPGFSRCLDGVVLGRRRTARGRRASTGGRGSGPTTGGRGSGPTTGGRGSGPTTGGRGSGPAASRRGS